MLLILAGRSGSGKSTIEHMLTERTNFKSVISYTTRQPREHEVNGVHYNFVSEDTFSKMLNEGKFLEYNYYQGNFYGISARDFSRNLVAVIEYNGIVQIKETVKNASKDSPFNNLDIVTIYLHASKDAVKARIPDRLDRVEKDDEIFTVDKYADIVDCMINANNDVETVYDSVYNMLYHHIHPRG